MVGQLFGQRIGIEDEGRGRQHFLSVVGINGGVHFLPPGIQHGAIHPVFGPNGASRHLRRQRFERAHGHQRNVQREAQALSGGGPDAQAGVGTGPVAHGHGGEVGQLVAGVFKQLLNEYSEVGGVRLIEPQLGLAYQRAVGDTVQGHRADGGRGFEREEERGQERFR